LKCVTVPTQEGEQGGPSLFALENSLDSLTLPSIFDFQVIRRGDRRPFYAPAKYVVELRPEEVDTLRRRHNAEVAAGLTPSTVAIAAENAEAPPSMTTFRSAAQRADNRNSAAAAQVSAVARAQPPSPLDRVENAFQVS